MTITNSKGLNAEPWRETVEKHCQPHGLNREENAMDHIRWKKQIRAD